MNTTTAYIGPHVNLNGATRESLMMIIEELEAADAPAAREQIVKPWNKIPGKSPGVRVIFPFGCGPKSPVTVYSWRGLKEMLEIYGE